jgi:cytochrome oxidase Cu insertion factor (SCO1/SenC/PrrC family)
MYWISLEPQHDTPAVLAEYARKRIVKSISWVIRPA